MIGLFLVLQTANPVVQLPPAVVPSAQIAKCVGVDNHDRRQTLTLESRWIPGERHTAMFVREDSSGILKEGDWLDNQSSIYRDGDRKYGLISTWDDTVFSKRVGDQYVRIAIRETDYLSSASIVYLVRPYSDREQTAQRHSNRGNILLAGHCSLLTGKEEVSREGLEAENRPDRPVASPR